MGGGRKGIERHHDLPTGGSGALPEVAAVLADAALIGEAAPPPRLYALVCRRPTTSSLASLEPAPAEVEEVVGLGPRIANAFVPRRKPPMPPRPAPTGGGGGSSPSPLADVPAMAPPPLLRVRDPPAPSAPRRCSSRAASPRRQPAPTHHRVELSWKVLETKTAEIHFWKVREGRGRCVRMRRGGGGARSGPVWTRSAGLDGRTLAQ